MKFEKLRKFCKQSKHFNEKHASILKNFEFVYNQIIALMEIHILETNELLVDELIHFIREKGLNNSFMYFNNAVDVFNKVTADKINISELIYILVHHMNLNIQYEAEYILSQSYDNAYPSYLRILRVYNLEKSKLNVKNNKLKNRAGLFFIYDKHEELAYIGNSTYCVHSRAFDSLRFTNLEDYYKIELYFLDSKSDTAIYLPYYVSLYKPYLNKEFVYDDGPSIELAEITDVYTIDGIFSNNIIKNTYYRQEIIPTSEFINQYKKGIVFLDNDKNISYLEENRGIAKENVGQATS